MVGGLPATLATAGGSLLRQGATNAAMGAVDAYGNSNKEGYDLARDVAAGGTIGGVLSTAPTMAIRGVDKAVETVTKSNAARSVEDLLKNKPHEWKKQLEKILGSTESEFKKEGTSVIQQAKEFVTSMKEKGPNAIKVSDLTIDSGKNKGNMVLEGIEATQPTWSRIGKEGLKTAGEGVVGGVVGGGINYLAGNPVDPTTAALGGAAVGAHSAGRQFLGELGTRVAGKVAASGLPTKLLNAGASEVGGVLNQLGTQAVTKDAQELTGGSSSPFGALSNYFSAARTGADLVTPNNEPTNIDSSTAEAEQDQKRKDAMKLQSTPEGRAQTNSENRITDLDLIK
jgi:hypothetical protein